MSYRFLSYLRTGAATAIAQRDRASGAEPRAAFQSGAEVWRDGAAWRTFAPVLRLFGPGDVMGLDAAQVLRSVPEPGAIAADPNDFAFVDLARADLPWLFTPFAPSAADTLTPWLCLVVIEQGDGVRLEPGPNGAVLTLDAPATLAELPDLATAHAWAHVQLEQATATDDVAALFAAHPERFRSRIVAARRLTGARRYVACVVPTYEGGRRAALGLDVDAATALAPAWTAATTLPLALPLFHHWEFTTSDAPSFETLARQLAPRADLGPAIGTRALAVGAPLATVGSVSLRLDGALRVVGTVHAAPPSAVAAALQARLEVPNTVSPPRYGRWHAASPPVGQPGAPPWLDALDTDPVRRVAAALGTRVVQEHQEALMAVVWEQAGEVLRANQLLRAATLARAAAVPMYVRRLLPLVADGAVLLLAAPAAARLRVGTFQTVRGAVRASCLPAHVLSGAFRRISRPGGPLSRRLRALADVPLRPARLVSRLASGELADVAPPLGDGAAGISAATLAGLVGRRSPLNSRLAPVVATTNTLAALDVPQACTPLDVGGVAQSIADRLDPRETIAARVGARLSLTAGVSSPTDGVGQVLVAPHLPVPMYRPLVALGPDWLLPGLGAIPRETLALVEPNRAFIEAYMVGLNHEMARELLWRGFPTDQRGTVFDHFWDGTDPDVVPLHGWRGVLGAHPGAGRAAVTVLVMRGELVRRFPAATVFLQRARATAGGGRTPSTTIGGEATELPIFGGRVGADVRFVGFGIDRDTARGGSAQAPHGYFLAFQQAPSALAFGPPSGGASGGYTSPAGAADATAAACVRQPFRLFIHADDLLP